MIIEAAAAAAMWFAGVERTPQHVQQQCAAGPEIAQCFQRKFERIDQQTQQHEDMWDPNWISKVEPVVERSAKGGQARVYRTYTAPATTNKK